MVAMYGVKAPAFRLRHKQATTSGPGLIGLLRRRLVGLAEIPYSPEILVNGGRLATATFGLIAIWLDPTRPGREVGAVRAVLAGYLAFSVLMLTISTKFHGRNKAARGFIHAIDIATLSLLVFFSEELDSPFFVFFTFTLVTAALQWGMRGILATALALQVLLLTLGLADLQDDESELNILVMRSAYCWVSAVMLGYFATYRERMRVRLAKLAAWHPEGAQPEHDDTFSRSLDDALEIMGARLVVVLWRPIAAATGHAVVRRHGVHEASKRISGAAFDELKRASEGVLVRPRDRNAAPFVHFLSQLVPFDPLTDQPFRWSSMCAIRLPSQRHDGAVIVVDGAGEKDQLVALANIVTLRIAVYLAQLASADEQAEAASLRERETLARDLHDGVLQHLTAAALHLKVARSDPKAEGERLSTVAGMLLDQQQQIRRFVEGARPAPSSPSQPLQQQLRRLAATLARQWACDFDVHVTPASLHLEDALVAELNLLMSEATANAVRHGQAQHVRWAVLHHDGALILTIEDDGHGLQAGEEQAIPRSLSARVAMLGGTLEISSKGLGLMLKVRLGVEERLA